MHRNQVRIDAPCTVAWDAMTGDATRRHCSSCDRPVHDLSAMRHADAAALLRAHADHPPCVRYTAAADGTLRFRDLVPRASLTRKLRTAVAASLLAACTPHGESEPPDLASPPHTLHTARVQPDAPPPADACDPVQPAPHAPEPQSTPAATPADPRPPTREEQQQAAEIDRALVDVQHRLRALDESVVYGQLTDELNRQGVMTAKFHKQAEAAERARLLELERQAMEAEAD